MSNSTDKKPKEEMSFFGIGPKMTLYLIPFIILFVSLNGLFYPSFQLPILHIWMIILGVPLIVIGILLYIKSAKIIKRAYYLSQLVITGTYSHSRHPLYGAVILFVVPGIVCLFNSWMLFFIPLAFYIIFRMLIKQEEEYCLKKFGKEYTHYKNKTNAIFPKLKKYAPN
jgi:protein-S-isoprenylcysteine O-methyltransferase Ste14